MLTEVQSGLDGRAGSMATLTGGGAEAELADGVLQWSSGAWIYTGRCGDVLRRCTRGQDEVRVTGGEEIGAAG